MITTHRLPPDPARISRKHRKVLKSLLACGPWMHPPEWRAQPHAPPPTDAPVGAALALSCQAEHHQGSVCLLLTAPPPLVHPRGQLTLGRAARQARQDAIIALGGALPLLWSSLHDALRRAPPYALHLNTVRPDDQQCIAPPKDLDGGSLGLAMALAMASRVLGLAPPAHIVAAATLNSMGATGPVDGLRLKLNALQHGCPGLRRRPLVLIHPAQDLDDLPQDTRADFCKVTSLSEAIARTWGNDLADQLLRDVRGADQRQEFIGSIFSMAIGDRSVSRVWAPIANAADMAARQWSDHLTPTQSWQLKLVQAIATRHDGRNSPSDPWPADESLRELPQPMRLQAVAHLIQQTTSDHRLDPARALGLGEHHVLRGADAFEGHLRVLGAMGRLMAVTGDPVGALRAQLEAMRQWLLRRAFFDLSYPMCQLYHLASTLHPETWAKTPDLSQAALIGELEEVFCRLQTLAPDKMSSYLIKVRAQARLLLPQWPAGYTQHDACQDLEALWHSRGQRLYLNWSAGRQLARWYRDRHQTAKLDAICHVFERADALPPDQARNRQTYRALMALDAALDAPDTAAMAPAQALNAFCDCRPALTARLLATCAHLPPTQQADHVRRFYPY